MTMQQPKKKILSDKWTFYSFIICLVGFGGFLLWASIAPLAEGVTAPGQIVVEDNRKVVQHLEGGIIRVLHVKEGDFVQPNDILVELETIAPLADRNEKAKEYATQLASVSRLTALIEGDASPDFSSLDDIPLAEEDKQEIISRQSALFTQQRSSHESELNILSARKNTLSTRFNDLGRQISTTRRSLEIAQEDLARKRTYLERKWETIDNVQRAEREVASLESELAQLNTTRNEARVTITEVEEELANTEAKFQTEMSGSLLDARQGALVLSERLGQSEDVLSRSVIRAPTSGKVLNLAFATVGGVVRPGEAIMEIVPDDSVLVAQVQVQPTDRDAVKQGQAVKAQLTSYKAWTAPRLDGEVLSISADLKTIEETGVSYYEAIILLDANSLDSDIYSIIPGLPVEAFIDSGNRRTFMQIVSEPIIETVRKGTSAS